jgi:hypothetical protein
MFFVIEVHRRATMVLLKEAATLETALGSATTAEAMYAIMSGRSGGHRALGQTALVVAGGCHLAVVDYLATGQNWTLAGG